MSISWEQKRFSLQYGGKALTEWPMQRETRENGAETVVCWRLEDGLVVTNVFRQCAEFSACEWVTWLENTGTSNSKMISTDRKSTRLNSSHSGESRMPSSA